MNIGDAMECASVQCSTRNGTELVGNRFWSGALFKSTVHRVRQAPESDGSGSAERYSIAFFCQPRRDAPLHNVSSASEVTQRAITAPVTVSRGTNVSFLRPSDDIARMEAKGVKLGEKLTAGEHLQRRLDRTYK